MKGVSLLFALDFDDTVWGDFDPGAVVIWLSIVKWGCIGVLFCALYDSDVIAKWGMMDEFS